MILLDTHALIWMDNDDPSLGAAARRLIQEAWDGQRLSVSAVSFWECAMLLEKRRLTLRLPPLTWRAELLAQGLSERPLDGQCAILAGQIELPHADPADRFIAATAIAHDATLVTADATLLRWRHKALRRQDARK
ncbi:MAG: type II toxin-antitoxin system VapC family toxin [Rhodospirillales bacterium]